MDLFLWGEPKKKKTVPKLILRRNVWERDKGVCQICGRKTDPLNWELGHKRAKSNGGQLTFKNTFVVHPSCNKSQRTLTFKQARKIAGGSKTPEEKTKDALSELTMSDLKYLAKKHGVTPKSRKVEGFLYDEVKAPGKRQYVNALAKTITPGKIGAELRRKPKTVKRKKKSKKDDFWSF